jgi:structural maintenance of chromosomes protein 6
LEAIEVPEKEQDPQYYEVRLEKIKKKLKAERQKRQLSKEDAAVAYEKYIRAKHDLAAKTKEVVEIDGQIEKLRSDLIERKKRWKQFRSHLSRATNIKFCEMLSLNNYHGELTISHSDKTLDLGVQKNASHSQVVSKDVKALR